jgi:hypothetical protein
VSAFVASSLGETALAKSMDYSKKSHNTTQSYMIIDYRYFKLLNIRVLV